MGPAFLSHFSPTVFQLALVLVLTFLVGLERESTRRGGGHLFGGVRTFPLLGLLGYALAFLGQGQILAFLIGLAVVGSLLVVSYWHKLATEAEGGATTEISGLVVYLVGALVYHSQYWLACALVVASLFLLELKASLEGLAERIAPEEITAFTKFLLLTAVILPLVPNQEFTPFHINPFRSWLVVVAVSGVSYGSYVLSKLFKGRGGVFLSGILGGIYSSTATTVVLAKQALEAPRVGVISGSILAASGMMYLRVLVLVGLLGKPLLPLLLPCFLGLSFLPLAFGGFWARHGGGATGRPETPTKGKNPLDLGAALAFAVIFLGMVVVTHLALRHLGQGGVYTLAAIMGVTDVDPMIMGMTQAAHAGTPLRVAAIAILVATSANNLAKGCYAWFFARGRAGRECLVMLGALAVLGLLPLFWI